MLRSRRIVPPARTARRRTGDPRGMLGANRRFPAAMMCAASRMIVNQRRRAAARRRLHLLPTIRNSTWPTLPGRAAKCAQPPHCDRFCVLGGASCRASCPPQARWGGRMRPASSHAQVYALCSSSTLTMPTPSDRAFRAGRGGRDRRVDCGSSDGTAAIVASSRARRINPPADEAPSSPPCRAAAGDGRLFSTPIPGSPQADARARSHMTAKRQAASSVPLDAGDAGAVVEAGVAMRVRGWACLMAIRACSSRAHSTNRSAATGRCR